MTYIKFCHVTQNIWQMWSCEQSLVNLVFLWEKLSKIQFYMDFAGKNDFWRGCHCLKIIHQRCKRVKTKSQKYSFHLMEKLLRKIWLGGIFLPSILNKVNPFVTLLQKFKTIPSTDPKLLNLKQEHHWKRSGFLGKPVQNWSYDNFFNLNLGGVGMGLAGEGGRVQVILSPAGFPLITQKG